MSIQYPGFWRRFLWAFRYFVLVLIRPEFARQVAELDQARLIKEAKLNQPAEEVVQEVPASEPVTAAPQPHTEATQADTDIQTDTQVQPVLQLLGLLQQEARLIDFLQEDVTQYGDADIGAAARVVHSGCRKVLEQYLELKPVMAEQEQSRVTIQSGFDPAEIHLTGRVSGQGPFNGVLMHKGWKVTRIQLPEMTAGHNVHVLAPAEVEV